jgi:putative acetyltransferase
LIWVPVNIRQEEPRDHQRVLEINRIAFQGGAEAQLVARLRDRAPRIISMVAVDGGADVVGHILFSPVTISDGAKAWSAMALGPMAVAPQCQRRGVGSALVRAGLEACSAAAEQAVFVLGHPWFYPRFGFVPASRYGIRCTFPAPDEAFMVVELTPGAIEGRTGVVKYLAEFDSV